MNLDAFRCPTGTKTVSRNGCPPGTKNVARRGVICPSLHAILAETNNIIKCGFICPSGTTNIARYGFRYPSITN